MLFRGAGRKERYAMYINYYDYLTEFIFVEDEPQKADYIFIPGCGRGELAVKAAQLYQEGFAPKIAVSGRYSILKGRLDGPKSPEAYVGRSYRTECDFLADVLRDEGVPEEAILKEDRAQYTYQNAIYTRELVGNAGRALIVCKPCHARRCLLYYQLLFPETELLMCPAPLTDITRDNWHRDPEKIDQVLGEVERCGSQFHDIMKERAQHD